MAIPVQVRLAEPGDRRIIWEWWNDPLTRQMMKKNAHVPWEEHCQWYDAVLQDPNRLLFVGLVGEDKLGVIRFTLQFDRIYEVSINLSPAFRGKGYASPFLSAAIQELCNLRGPVRLVAGCKKVNLPSQKTFSRSGFTFKPIDRRYPSLHSFDPETELFCELVLDAA